MFVRPPASGRASAIVVAVVVVIEPGGGKPGLGQARRPEPRRRFAILEHAAAEKLQDLREEIQEHMPFHHHRSEEKKRVAKREGDGD